MSVTVVILTKDCTAGLVKTRLAQRIGHSDAANVHRILSMHCIETAIASGLRVIVSFAGSLTSSFATEIRQTGCSIIQQPDGTLGDKIFAAMQLDERVIVLGTDTPNFTPQLLSSAANDNTIVVGPAKDGGYWLYAASKPPFNLFADIPWSTSNVLEKSIIEIKRQRLSYRLLPTLSDVDYYLDLVNILSDPLTPSSLLEQLKPYARS